MKKVGGVKIRPGAGDSPSPHRHITEAASTQPVTLAPKKLGAIKASARTLGTSIYHPQPCCAGERVPDGMWIHSPTCPHTAVIWKAHGKQEKDWHCSHHCVPEELPSCWTHHRGCAWWDEHGEHAIETVLTQEHSIRLSAEEAGSRGEADDDIPF